MAELTYEIVNAARDHAHQIMLTFVRSRGWEWNEPTKGHLGVWSKKTEGSIWSCLTLIDAFEMESGL